MHRLVVVVALAGCGRSGFAPEPPDAPVSSDAVVDAPPGAIAFVQHANTMCAAGTTCAHSFMQFVQPGHGIVVTTTYDSRGVTVTSVTDTSGNTYHPAVAGVDWPVSTFRTSTWFGTHAGASGVLRITVQYSAAPASFAYLYIDEYANATAVADTASATGNGNTLTPTSGSRAVSAGELVFGHAEGQGPTVGVGLNFTLRDTSNMNIEEDRLISADGSYDAQFTLDNLGEWMAVMVVLR
jgi:hypothetical protein